MKNTKTILTTIIALLVLLIGALLWMRNSQQARVGAGAVPTPALDIRAVKLSSAANTLMVDGKYVEAADMFRKSLEIQKDPFIKYQLGRALMKAGRKEEAIQAFEQVAQGQWQNDIMSRKAREEIDKLKRS